MSLIQRLLQELESRPVIARLRRTAPGVGITPPTPGGLVSLTLIATTTTDIQPGGAVTFQGTSTDEKGNALSGVPAAVLDNGTSTGQTIISNSSGIYAFSLNFANPGTFGISIRSGTVTSPTVTVTVAAITPPPALASITLSSSATSVQAGGTVAFTALAKDASGNPLSGVLIQPEEGGATIGTPVTTTSGGSANFSISFPNPGTFSITAVSGSVVSNTISITVTSPLPILGSIQLSPTTTTSISTGGNVSFLGKAFNTAGATIANVPITILENNAAVGITNLVSDSTGSFAFTLGFANAGTFLIVARSGTISSPAVTVTVTAPPPTLASLALAGPTSSSTGVATTYKATATSSAGVPISGVSANLLLNGAIAQSTTTDSTGSAYFNVTYVATGTYTLEVESGTITSNTITTTVTAGATAVFSVSEYGNGGNRTTATVNAQNLTAGAQSGTLKLTATNPTSGAVVATGSLAITVAAGLTTEELVPWSPSITLPMVNVTAEVVNSAGQLISNVVTWSKSF